MGIPEIVVIVFVLFFVILQFWLPLFLRKRYPERIWIGLIVAFFIGPFAQLYVGGARAIIISITIVFIGALSFDALLDNRLASYLAMNIWSSIIMYYRLLRLQSGRRI
jgi:hypothetical protein